MHVLYYLLFCFLSSRINLCFILKWLTSTHGVWHFHGMVSNPCFENENVNLWKCFWQQEILWISLDSFFSEYIIYNILQINVKIYIFFLFLNKKKIFSDITSFLWMILYFTILSYLSKSFPDIINQIYWFWKFENILVFNNNLEAYKLSWWYLQNNWFH